MRFVDDLRRQTVLSDYEHVADDLINDIADDDLTICRYGGCQPPISDLDLVVLTEPAMSARRVQALRDRLHAFRVASPVRQYLVDDEIRLCPSDLYSKASGKCLNMVPTPLTQISGPAVPIAPPPRTVPHRQISLVNNLASQVIELEDLSRQETSSLRETLKTVRRVCGFGRAQIEQSIADEPRVYADAGLRAEFDALERDVDTLRQQAVEQLVDEVFEEALASALVRARRLLVEAMQVYCDDFLRSVLTLVTPGSPTADGSDLPALVRCHIAAHAAVTAHASPFRQALERWAPASSFVVTDAAYRQALTAQMATVHIFEVRFRTLGIASFPLEVAGLWHQSYPMTRWAALRSRFMPGRPQDGARVAHRDPGSSRH